MPYAIAGAGPSFAWAAEQAKKMRDKQETKLGGERFTITEKQAKQRQDGTWYFEVVKVEKSAMA